jgi:Glycolipid transfer protein (GLTP)
MYQTTLSPYHHSWTARPLFQAGLKLVPYRKDFFPKLGEDQDKVHEQGKDFVGGVDKVMAVLNPFMDSKREAIGVKKY